MGHITQQAFNRPLQLHRGQISVKYRGLIAYHRGTLSETDGDREIIGCEGLHVPGGFTPSTLVFFRLIRRKNLGFFFDASSCVDGLLMKSSRIRSRSRLSVLHFCFQGFLENSICQSNLCFKTACNYCSWRFARGWKTDRRYGFYRLMKSILKRFYL